MTPSHLMRLSEARLYGRWGFPFRNGRKPFDVQFCHARSAFFARYDPLEELSAPASRAAIKERLEG